MKTSCWRCCAVYFMMGLRNCQARCVFTATIKCPVLNMFICAALCCDSFCPIEFAPFLTGAVETQTQHKLIQLAVFWGFLMKLKQSKYYFGDVSLSVWQISNPPSSGSIFCPPFQGEIFYCWSNQTFLCSPASCWPAFKGLYDGSGALTICRNIQFKTCKAKATRREMLKLTHKAGGNCRVRQFFLCGFVTGSGCIHEQGVMRWDVDLK